MPRLRRAPEESKTRILDAAEEVFARDGYDLASLAGIGEAAGVSRGLPAYFFKTKEHLYTAVVGRGREDIQQVVERSLAGASQSLEMFLERSIGAFIDYLAAHPNMVRLLQWEFLHAPGTPRQNAPIALFFETTLVLHEALQRTRAADVDARQLLLSIVGMCFFPFTVVDSHAIDATFLETRKRHIVNIVLAGIVHADGGSHE